MHYGNHTGLSETFQIGTDEKGVAAWWVVSKHGCLFATGGNLSTLRQQLCCCYFCLISLGLGGISGSLSNHGWNHPSLSNNFVGLSGSCRLRSLSLMPNVQLNIVTGKQRRKFATTLSVLTAAWLSDLSLAG